MTRQSLSRFLSERRELRTFMTLPLISEAARPPAKRRGNYWPDTGLSTRQKRVFSSLRQAKKGSNSAKNSPFPGNPVLKKSYGQARPAPPDGFCPAADRGLLCPGAASSA